MLDPDPKMTDLEMETGYKINLAGLQTVVHVLKHLLNQGLWTYSVAAGSF